MPKTRECTVLFADLRGSTALYETVGNAAAARVVTAQVASIADVVARCGGRVVKTLGDGLMAVFDTPAQGVQAAHAMHDMPASLPAVPAASAVATATPAPLKLQVALAAGEVVFVDDDCFGDAVNVAARLLDHADDNETLVTATVLAGIDASERVRFRSLGPMQLRGRAEPVHVCLLEAPSVAGGPADNLPTVMSELELPVAPQGIRLTWLDLDRFYTAAELPLVLGRGSDADYRVDDSRVSRQHARIDADGGKFQLNDLSYNGTYVCFANNAGMLSLRRGACLLHGSGIIALGTATIDALSPCIRFEVRH